MSMPAKNDLSSASTSSDRLYVNSRRESVVLLVGFAVFLCWSVGTSYWLGYDVDPAELGSTFLGMPRWVFWGIAVPWMGANVFTIVFCLFFMADDPLEDTTDRDAA